MSSQSHHDQRTLPYARQWIDEDDIAAVVDVLRSDWLTSGPMIDRFEEALATYCGAQHAIAVCNGTAALHLALKAVGIGPGDRVLTSANTFLASANAAEFLGATADFADIDPVTRCLSIETLQNAWKPDVKAVVAVDFAGYPCVSEEMADFIHAHRAFVVEDACHALGSQRDRYGSDSDRDDAGDRYRTGGLPWVDLTTFSFHPVKTLTTGEGGAILTHNPSWAEKCRLNRNHGVIRPDTEQRSLLRPYTMEEPGYNYRITDLQSALGLSQLKKLDNFIARRRDFVARYNTAFGTCPHLQLPVAPGDVVPSWHLYALWINFEELGQPRETMREALLQRGVGTQIHYYPVHLQPYYANRYGYTPGKCPEAEAWYEHALTLPLFPAMTDEHVDRVIAAVQACLHI